MYDYSKPIPVDDLTMLFGPDIIEEYLPRVEDIPKDFFHLRNEWNNLAETVLFRGGDLPQVKPGIDKLAAERHIKACFASLQPKHEHKSAGVGYLMSLWFDLETEVNPA